MTVTIESEKIIDTLKDILSEVRDNKDYKDDDAIACMNFYLKLEGKTNEVRTITSCVK